MYTYGTLNSMEQVINRRVVWILPDPKPALTLSWVSSEQFFSSSRVDDSEARKERERETLEVLSQMPLRWGSRDRAVRSIIYVIHSSL